MSKIGKEEDEKPDGGQPCADGKDVSDGGEIGDIAKHRCTQAAQAESKAKEDA